MISLLSESPIIVVSSVAVMLFLAIFWGTKLKNQRLSILGFPFVSKLTCVPPIFLTLLLTFATLRPSTGNEQISVKESTVDLMVIVDISLSMLATDISPSRLEVAKQKILDIIELSGALRKPLRLGITVFSGSSYVYCPLTNDRTVLRSFTESIYPNLTASRGSSISQAVDDAINDIKRSGNPQGANILLLSDGESDDQDRLSVSTEFPIHTIGFGTKDGATIPLRGGGVLQDDQRKIVVTHLEEDNLKEISEKSGGSYQLSTIGDTDIRLLLNKLTQRGRDTGYSGTQTVEHEITTHLLYAALIFLTLMMLFEREKAVLYVILFSFITLSPERLQAQESIGDMVNAGEQAFRDGDFNTATEKFSSLAKNSSAERSFREGLAASQFKAGNYENALQTYSSLVESASNPKERFEALFNSGNTALMMKRYKEAIKQYELALETKPNDQRAMDNKRYAESLLEEFPPTPTPTPTPTQEQQNNQNNQPTATPTPTPTPPTEGTQPAKDGEPTPTPTPTPTSNSNDQTDLVSPDSPEDQNNSSPSKTDDILDEIEDRTLLLPRQNDSNRNSRKRQLW